MSSKRKIDSARANGAKSHGPITEQGRKTSSMNALKLGLTARTVVFPNENQDEYDAMLDYYIQHLQPTDPAEMDQVVDMVNAKWQQRRFNNMETQMYALEMEKQKPKIDQAYQSYNEILQHTLAFETLVHSVALHELNRTQTRLERTYSRALNNLIRLRKLPKSTPAATIQENEKRTQSHDRTPATNGQSHHQPPLEAQPELTPQPSAALTSTGNPDPAAAQRAQEPQPDNSANSLEGPLRETFLSESSVNKVAVRG
jgi:hypothetical protein